MNGIATGGRRRALWFTIFWLGVGIASFVLGVQNPIGQRAEDILLDAAEFTTNPPAPLNLVSIPSIAIALLLLGVLALFAHGIQRALVVTLLPAAAIATSQLLKLHVLTRPELFELDAPNTFPSGHMTVFTALTAALIWAVPAQIRAFVALAGAGLLGAVGWQLLAYGWHRPSDVLGALALGVIAFALAGLIRPARTRGTVTLGATISIGLVLLGWIMVAAALTLAAIAGVSGNADLMLSAGEFGGVGASALAARALLLLSVGRD
ncbi:PAP2 superfamily protein [Leucobacter luti]|uniref:PAP2 superfamily protein n=1 Tax=Leucobacter luti TaxID=340320 RepID=A0A4R6RZZ9_9MICO|nr:phosphatase PAP2 family protein [Leucobacter luti]TDP92514.1 PAP2 superfamily protein [Leucobacter luti]